MSTESTIVAGAVAPRKSLLRRIRRAVQYALAAVVILLVGWHFVWKYSGSGQWRLVLNRDGIQVYTLKIPGQTLEKFKGVGEIHSTVDRAVAAMMDTNLNTCRDWSGSGCLGVKTIIPWNPKEHTVTTLTRYQFPFPFSLREFLLRTQLARDARDGSVLITFTAVPHALPADSCCVRINHVHNTWRYTPVGNGELRVEYVENSDLGIPYFLYYAMHPDNIYNLFVDLPDLLNRKQYDGARFALEQK